MKKTGDVFWKVAFKPRGSKSWEYEGDVFSQRYNAVKDMELSRLASDMKGRRKVVKATLYVNE